LTGGQTQYFGLTAEEDAAADRVAQALFADRRFEHIAKPADTIWYFTCRCWLDKTTDHVPAFIQSHGREVARSVCYIPVEFLSVAHEMELLGIRLLPVDDPRIPALGAWFKLDKPVGCVAAVDSTGTSYERMAERARAEAAHALRRLRVALREQRGVNDHQLRFQLAIAFAFDSGGSGWRHRGDIAYELELDGGVLDLIAEQPVATMPLEPSTDVARKADVALRWMERAWLSGDPLTALLFLFFALEALLGDKSEGLKAHGLAFRQTMLSHILTEGFFHPNRSSPSAAGSSGCSTSTSTVHSSSLGSGKLADQSGRHTLIELIIASLDSSIAAVDELEQAAARTSAGVSRWPCSRS
jgi:hypothetical protein